MQSDRFAPGALAWLAGALLLAWLQFDALRTAFEVLGFSAAGALALLAACAAGSLVNLPLARLGPRPTVVALNVGGALVPVLVAGWVAVHARLGLAECAGATGLVAVASWRFSRVQPGVGVTMRGFVAPLAALLAGVLLGAAQPAPLAYVSGTLGVLIGADLVRLREATRTGAALLSIGGAGTRDGIFLAGVLAVLIA